jgi:hypothetical protein
VSYGCSSSEGASLVVQPCLQGFILMNDYTNDMVGAINRTTMSLSKFLGKGDSDVEKHCFLCESIWREKMIMTLDANHVPWEGSKVVHEVYRN